MRVRIGEVPAQSDAAAARSGVALGDGVRSFLERIDSHPAYQRALQAVANTNSPDNRNRGSVRTFPSS
jgi:hypothetical protein